VRTLARSALIVSLAAALLVGCGGSQPPIGAPGVTPQTSAIASARSAVHRLSASYQQLYRFSPAQDGARPGGGLLDVSGTLYGTTDAAGRGGKGRGTVYRITTGGEHKVLYRFKGVPDGRNPQSGLLNVNGTLYGTTSDGGGPGCYEGGCGTVYSVTTSGTEKVVYAFKGKGGSDGCHPGARLIDVNGTLYGTTSGCGDFTCNSAYGCGTVFSVTTSGQETVLHSFAGSGSDGADPEAELIDVNGVLYGTTAEGGTGFGTVYSITPAGVEKVLYAFQGQTSGTDGVFPVAGLINVNGTLYGTTRNGGSFLSRSGGCGTVYSISTSGAEKVVYRFTCGSDGAEPASDLTEMNGVLYGTTAHGGNSHGFGTIFKVSTSGRERVLYRFGAIQNDGITPSSRLTNLNRTLYGTTAYGGGTHGYGTVFALTP
jgi:uncharacterized repeat protein (TIGR03803 family)